MNAARDGGRLAPWHQGREHSEFDVLCNFVYHYMGYTASGFPYLASLIIPFQTYLDLP